MKRRGGSQRRKCDRRLAEFFLSAFSLCKALFIQINFQGPVCFNETTGLLLFVIFIVCKAKVEFV